jgi:hypothetical protein
MTSQSKALAFFGACLFACSPPAANVRPDRYPDDAVDTLIMDPHLNAGGSCSRVVDFVSKQSPEQRAAMVRSFDTRWEPRANEIFTAKGGYLAENFFCVRTTLKSGPKDGGAE